MRYKGYIIEESPYLGMNPPAGARHSIEIWAGNETARRFMGFAGGLNDARRRIDQKCWGAKPFVTLEDERKVPDA